jgi:1-acyl-sn-glycerol-3-phosphate acyltransferase
VKSPESAACSAAGQSSSTTSTRPSNAPPTASPTSGVEQLKPGRAYLFLANHRDIVMDPAFVNYAVYHAGLPTPRIAIGDNLLQSPSSAT